MRGMLSYAFHTVLSICTSHVVLWAICRVRRAGVGHQKDNTQKRNNKKRRGQNARNNTKRAKIRVSTVQSVVVEVAVGRHTFMNNLP